MKSINNREFLAILNNKSLSITHPYCLSIQSLLFIYSLHCSILYVMQYYSETKSILCHQILADYLSPSFAPVVFTTISSSHSANTYFSNISFSLWYTSAFVVSCIGTSLVASPNDSKISKNLRPSPPSLMIDLITSKARTVIFVSRGSRSSIKAWNVPLLES